MLVGVVSIYCREQLVRLLLRFLANDCPWTLVLRHSTASAQVISICKYWRVSIPVLVLCAVSWECMWWNKTMCTQHKQDDTSKCLAKFVSIAFLCHSVFTCLPECIYCSTWTLGIALMLPAHCLVWLGISLLHRPHRRQIEHVLTKKSSGSHSLCLQLVHLLLLG